MVIQDKIFAVPGFLDIRISTCYSWIELNLIAKHFIYYITC